MEGDRKQAFVGVRFAEFQKAKLRAAASIAGVSLSDLVRSAAVASALLIEQLNGPKAGADSDVDSTNS